MSIVDYEPLEDRCIINMDVHFCNTLLQKEKEKEGNAQGPKLEQKMKKGVLSSI